MGCNCSNWVWDSIEAAKKIHAFADGRDIYLRASRNPDVFLSEIIHEGTHAMDNLLIAELEKLGKTKKEIDKILGNNWSFEKRAFFHERAWQEATGM